MAILGAQAHCKTHKFFAKAYILVKCLYFGLLNIGQSVASLSELQKNKTRDQFNHSRQNLVDPSVITGHAKKVLDLEEVGVLSCLGGSQ